MSAKTLLEGLSYISSASLRPFSSASTLVSRRNGTISQRRSGRWPVKL